ncbi:MAG TPA: DNA primase [Solirubrobacteraceae bacterium]|nr:DNA primase [Solirubrobacteraceae bacterium]
MSRYTADSRDRVFDAVDMVALVSTRTELSRKGPDSYFGLCPFHEERTGSFHVRPDEKHYFCFGCQASGDPFTFVMETEGLDFKGAMEALADRFGVTLETEDEDPAAASRRARNERLYTLLGRTATYYARYLWESREAGAARGYLLGRGLTEETLREFKVGYAPSAWDRILRASREAGFTEQELLDAGLIQRSKTRPGQVYDRFRERIMFPAVDARGRTRGFGARAMRENQPPKYLNTSDGAVYHKRSQLFGIDLARAPSAGAGRMILVEGYTDVLALHQAGLRNTVGIMGTALTEEQVRELERIVKVLELCLDADRAGQEAMLRAARLADGSKLELRVVSLPEGTDPAELLMRDGGADELRERVQGSVPFVAFHVERILERADTGSAEGRDRAVEELRPVMNALRASALREELMRKVASKLELSELRLASLMAAAGNGAAPGNGAPSSEPDSARPADHGFRSERTFLALCIALPQEGAAVLAAIDPDAMLTSAVLRRAARHLAPRTGTPLADLPPDDEELARTVADLVALAGRAGDVSAVRLEHARLVLDLARLDRAIARARAGGAAGISELAREREQVRARIHEVVVRLEGSV